MIHIGMCLSLSVMRQLESGRDWAGNNGAAEMLHKMVTSRARGNGESLPRVETEVSAFRDQQPLGLLRHAEGLECEFVRGAHVGSGDDHQERLWGDAMHVGPRRELRYEIEAARRYLVLPPRGPCG